MLGPSTFVTQIPTKAALVYSIFLAASALSYGAGYATGALKWVGYEAALNSSVLRFSKDLEYKLPGYGTLLRSYKAEHGPQRRGRNSSRTCDDSASCS